MAQDFKRTKENFLCGHCGTHVVGDGYTNHCPACLWSKHVDITPGDRGEKCRGMMKPVSCFQKSGAWHVVQKCERCGREWKNELKEGDNFDVLVGLSKEE